MGNKIYDPRREIQEAVKAGEEALGLLEKAKRLNSAGNWGLVDMLE